MSKTFGINGIYDVQQYPDYCKPNPLYYSIKIYCQATSIARSVLSIRKSE